MHLSTFVLKKLPGKRGNENKEGNFFHGEKPEEEVEYYK